MIGKYPSSPIWWKRIYSVLIICTAGLTIFLINLNDHIWRDVQQKALESNVILPNNALINEVALLSAPIFKAIEETSFTDTQIGRALPRSANLKSKDSVFKQLQSVNNDFLASLIIIIDVLRVITYLMCIPILSSLIWLFNDYKKGKSKSFTLLLLIIAFFINFKSYVFLYSNFGMLLT